MSDFPARLLSSNLWKKLSDNSNLSSEIIKLREVVETLSSKIGDLLPEYTDHSIRHIDALWAITDEVVTSEEFSAMTIGEAFILSGALLLHDLGMAICATEEGIEKVKTSSAFVEHNQMLLSKGLSAESANILALRNAARILHASTAQNFACEQIPGLNRYLFETTETRQNWGMMIGQVAASHHWSLTEVGNTLGIKERIPDAAGSEVDLAYIACILRVVDFAHINMDRASTLERALRRSMPKSSSTHWEAQQHITGPRRIGGQLVFGCNAGISDVDGWWTFYEMAKGLDAEIASVGEFLASRSCSTRRFSLEGVKGVRSAQTFCTLVSTSGFEPIDIRFKPDSMERLVELLGSKTLYGHDIFAPIREILQNAVDAIAVSQIELEKAGVISEQGQIRISLEQRGESWFLDVADNGTGMSPQVISKYLLGIAADYWNSPEYFAEHPDAALSKFKPIGRFGIGFLSVFMIGDDVEVFTQRRGGANLKLRLHGVGQRGSLEHRSTSLVNGTKVSIRLKPELVGALLDRLPQIVLKKAPMTTIPIQITTPKGVSQIVPGWWKTVSQQELATFVDDDRITRLPNDRMWHGVQPEIVSPNSRVIAVPGASTVLICSKGFAISATHAKGIFGIVDVGEQTLNAARSQLLEWGSNQFRSDMVSELRPHLIQSLNNLVTEGDVPARYEFLIEVIKCYGMDILFESTLPWITIRKSPGDAVLTNLSTFVNEYSNSKEIFLVYGTSPWDAERQARRMFQGMSNGILVLPVSDVTQPQFGNYDDREVIEGTLQEHLDAGRKLYTTGDLCDVVLLQATMIAIARAWHTEPEFLQIRWRRIQRLLCGYVARS